MSHKLTRNAREVVWGSWGGSFLLPLGAAAVNVACCVGRSQTLGVMLSKPVAAQASVACTACRSLTR